MSSILSVISFSLLKEGYQIGLDWLGQFARVIIEGVGVIGAGIIVFALVLKAITLPFDIYQRIKMRKQTLIMRQMQPDLEKLQQQYANDKNMYNQKMMELYKKNGYSMMGACLPMIVSLLILIFAFQGFRTYSQYANLKMYVQMSSAYNAAILENGVEGEDFYLPTEEEPAGELVINWETLSKDGVSYTVTTEEGVKLLEVKSEDASKYVYYDYSLETTTIVKNYRIDKERLLARHAEEVKAFEEDGKYDEDTACKLYVNKIGAKAAANWYHDNDASFLWIKNVWYPDVTYNHPIQSYKNFSSSFSGVKVTYPDGEKKALINELDETSYNNLISELQKETKTQNGYFILIILSIGLMVLSQFISMKSNKENNKYQTVDGSGARTQKVMLVAMPLIYAVFAFMYSAAFSIYMVISSAVAIITTLVSNLVIGAVFKKKEAQMEQERIVRKLPWMIKEEDKKGKKKKK